MNKTFVIKITTATVFLVITIITGLLLAAGLKPYNQALLIIHKLSAIGFTVLIGNIIFPLIKKIDKSLILLVLILAANVSALLLFVTGGLLTANKNPAKIFKIVHSIAPYFLILFISLILSVVFRRKKSVNG